MELDKTQEENNAEKIRKVEDIVAELKSTLDKEKTEDLFNCLEPYFTETIDEVLSVVEDKIDILDEKFSNFVDDLNSDSSIDDLTASLQSVKDFSRELKDVITARIESLDEKFQLQLSLHKNNLNTSLVTKYAELKSSLARLEKTTEGISESIDKINPSLDKKITKSRSEVEEAISKLREEVFQKISTIGRGGNMNRNISIGGNSSVLSRYTDVNLKAGTNVAITYANNDTTKNVDVTFTGTGGIAPTIPTGTVNGVNLTFTAGSTPTIVFTEGGHFTNGFGVTITGLTIVFDAGLAPQQWIKYI